MGIKVSVPLIVKNKIRILNLWSAIEEIVTQLSTFETAHKAYVIHQQLKIMSSNSVGTKLYTPDVIVRAFSYFATSRSLYNRMRSDFQFPSIRTLTRITSSFSKQSDLHFLTNIFQSLEEEQKICILLLDEVYIKKMFQYYGEEIFGKSANYLSKLAETMLGLMINCLLGGPKFRLSLIPVL